MSDKQKALLLSIAVLTVAICMAVSLTIYLLYTTALKEESHRLIETVDSHASLIM